MIALVESAYRCSQPAWLLETCWEIGRCSGGDSHPICRLLAWSAIDASLGDGWPRPPILSGSERGDWARLVATTGRAFSFYPLVPRRPACAGCSVNRANNLPLAKLDYSSRRIVHGAGHAMRGAQHHASQSIGRDQQPRCRGHCPPCGFHRRDDVGVVACGLPSAVAPASNFTNSCGLGSTRKQRQGLPEWRTRSTCEKVFGQGHTSNLLRQPLPHSPG